jgi:hypothetical protein
MDDMTPDLMAFADGLVADFAQNLEYLAAEAPPAGSPEHARFGWSLALGTLALDTFESLVTLLAAGKTRAAYMLVRPLIATRVRLRAYVKDGERALADWNARELSLAGVTSLFEPDEWDDEGHASIEAAFAHREVENAADFAADCAFLSEVEKREGELRWARAAVLPEDVDASAVEYGWARAAWLVSGAFARGDRAIVSDLVSLDAAGHVSYTRNSTQADTRAIFFESVWYLLDVMDSFGMVRSWVYGAVKQRQDAIELYLAGKKATSDTSATR